MNGYAKIRVARPSTTKSRSIYFSDLISFPQKPKPILNTTSPNPNSIAQESNQIKNTPTRNTHDDSLSDQEDDHHEEANGKIFGEVLRRSSSINSSSGTTSVVKKVFSMRRSSSVSERYCRIHDQSFTLRSSSSPPPFMDDDEVNMDKMQTRSMKKKNRTGKILKACKRLFGL